MATSSRMLKIKTDADVKTMKAERESVIDGFQPGGGEVAGGFGTDCRNFQTDIGWEAGNPIVVWTAVGGVGAAVTGLSL